MTSPSTAALDALPLGTAAATVVTAPRDEYDGTVTVLSRQTAADGVTSLVLAPRDGVPLPRWRPGAHIDVVLPTGAVRQYSLCGPTAITDCWRIAVLREPDGRGGSQWIHDEVREASELRIRGPRNNFPLRQASRYLFVAGGIGVTPLLPMIAEAAAAGADWSLLYGGRSRASMAFLSELEGYGERVTVRPQDEYGLLDLAGHLGDPDPSALVYCCGPAGLIDAVEAHCATWPPGSLHVERFAATPGRLAGDGEADEPFEVELRSSGTTVTVQPGQSVLKAVEAAGAPVLSSCEEGICGSCETAVLAGEIDHRDSLLTDDERAAGDTMLICVSRARGGRLVLDL
ncbi:MULTISPECIES: PDR/VanB family oxidoreductase [Streptomyces]|uniref:PDR/VanB family oxidoreductase n=1 Tax=Streptomyces caniscabiei TaxID=2746961 RepID=A0ABU4MNE2_9ACTN|nr:MULTISPECIES: PDR/VanB family oxidoreductase [Streptomyces]MBE4738453.1 oxidoreductase [Streptomyces caniscabiei]MBE4756750.1 oxidoreductase [Streptomyces caniscabiei]MBE4768745.1 oxidoreductase [Streptomyces caniscabiei]MBE4783121.1 oxidoreductase [Streptomyces caniscabiei]MBE4792425.1 oxidoreductase [Streptomyces caniscabiei]